MTADLNATLWAAATVAAVVVAWRTPGWVRAYRRWAAENAAERHATAVDRAARDAAFAVELADVRAGRDATRRDRELREEQAAAQARRLRPVGMPVDLMRGT